jgi:hypothetical protein
MTFIQKYAQCVKQYILEWTPKCFKWLSFHLFTSWNREVAQQKIIRKTMNFTGGCWMPKGICLESKEIYYLSQLVMIQSLLHKWLRLCADRIQLDNELPLTWSSQTDCIKYTILLSLRWLHMHRPQGRRLCELLNISQQSLSLYASKYINKSK